MERISPEQASECRRMLNAVIDNIETVIVGKRHVVELVVLSLVSGGHVLIEDVPGVGKTSLVSALARTISCSFKRIQFTPDVMPSDITGFSVYNQKSGEFEFRSGAVMSQIVLADEINRASAKTQASLLEAMEEKQVTVDSHTYHLEEPFMVLATQNPLDSFGTYPLPEAQIDRFLMKLSIGYPEPEEEVRVALEVGKAKKALQAAASGEDILQLRRAAEQVYIAPELSRYIVTLVNATRNHPDVLLGSSPRGTIALVNASRAYALYQGRSYVTPEDVKYLALPVLAHRIILTNDAKIARKTGRDVVASVLDRAAVPMTGRS